MILGTGVEIRPVKAAELPSLAGNGSTFGLLRNRLNRRDAGNGELLAAWIEGVAVGHIFIWTDDAEEEAIRNHLPGIPLVMNLWVKKPFRKRGIGTSLVLEAERWLVERGHCAVALGVDPGNREAVRLYLRLWYDPWRYGDVKTEYEEFHDDGTSAGRTFEICAVYVKDLTETLAEARVTSMPPATRYQEGPIRNRVQVETISASVGPSLPHPAEIRPGTSI